MNVIVPNSLSEKRIEGLIKSRTAWIRQKLIEQHERVPVKPKEYVNCETFTYLGRNYRLKLDENAKGGVKLKNGYLVVPNNKEVSQSENDGILSKLWKRGTNSVPMKSCLRRLSAMQLFWALSQRQ